MEYDGLGSRMLGEGGDKVEGDSEMGGAGCMKGRVHVSKPGRVHKFVTLFAIGAGGDGWVTCSSCSSVAQPTPPH